MLGTWRWLWPAFHLSCLLVHPRLQLGRRPVWSAPLLKSVGFKMVIHYANKSFQFPDLWQMYNENEISKFCLLLSHWKISENQPRYSWFFFWSFKRAYHLAGSNPVRLLFQLHGIKKLLTSLLAIHKSTSKSSWCQDLVSRKQRILKSIKKHQLRQKTHYNPILQNANSGKARNT